MCLDFLQGMGCSSSIKNHPFPIIEVVLRKPAHNTVSLPSVLSGKEKVLQGVRIVVLQSCLRFSDRKIEIY